MKSAPPFISSRAQQLPDHILVDIFIASVVPYPEIYHGGSFAWVSHETIKPMGLVCRAWHSAAQSALYRSIAIESPNAASQLARTFAARPDLALKTRNFVMGLGTRAERERSDDRVGVDYLRSSEDLIVGLNACLNVRHLQIRPLHHAVVDDLLTSLRRLSLYTLVVAPKLPSISNSWTTELFRNASDTASVVLPTLRRLELECWERDGHLPQPFDPLPTLSLRQLKIHCEIHEPLLHAILSNAPNLLGADLVRSCFTFRDI